LHVVNVVKQNLFRDSIQLMKLTEDVKTLRGVGDAVVSMGTDTNKRLLGDLHLLGKEAERAGDGDLVIAVRVSEGANRDDVMARVEAMVMAPPVAPGETRRRVFHSIGTAMENLGGANLAVVSVPGRQAFEPSMELLKKGVNIHLFSDHVTKKEEIELKKFASSKGLLVLGPGAGTSIINGVGLGFANSVRRGDVGIVASAGTGIQEAAIMLDRVGLGVSHALGVGGTDVSQEVGGMMMKDCLKLLEADRSTKTIMIIAKAPAEGVFQDVMRFVDRETSKPVMACFLGLTRAPDLGRRVRYAKTLHSAVARAAEESGAAAAREFRSKVAKSYEGLLKSARERSSKVGGRKYVRGLYSGGTIAHETLLIFRELMGEAYSNTPLSEKFALSDPNRSKGNSVVDLGDESFTAGRAHPMIDPTLRRLRLVQEAEDPTVAVILLDIVLGYGSSPDPAGALQKAIEEGRRSATKHGGELVVMAHVCGTDSDPQSLKEQSAKLIDAGAILFPSNALMAAEAALVVGGDAAATNLKRKWGDLLG
jgi:succinyl-CoA synthetase alpha subunit